MQIIKVSLKIYALIIVKNPACHRKEPTYLRKQKKRETTCANKSQKITKKDSDIFPDTINDDFLCNSNDFTSELDFD